MFYLDKCRDIMALVSVFALLVVTALGLIQQMNLTLVSFML